MVQLDEYTTFDAVPDGIIISDIVIPHILIPNNCQIPLSGLSLNTFLDNQRRDDINEYLKLCYFVIYNVCKDSEFVNYKSVTEHIMLKADSLGKVENYEDINRVAREINARFPYIRMYHLKDIVYRIWTGDYQSMIDNDF